MKFQIYVDHHDEYRWRLFADNGEEISDSNEGYKDIRDCKHAIELIKNAVSFAPVEELL
jgi:uncharacterized protein YegP (UPF0339 family)